MDKNELISSMLSFKDNIGMWKIVLNQITDADFVIGYGFDNNEFKNLEEVGKLIGISREGTRKALVKAFKKIRDNKDLKDYLNY